MNTIVIIPAAGIGQRFDEHIPKQFFDLNGIPILIRTLKTFDLISAISKIVLVLDPEWQSFIENKIFKFKVNKTTVFVKGGKERQDSVANALFSNHLSNAEIVLIHDAVRPLFSVDLCQRIIRETEKYNAVIPAIKPTDTIKLIDKNNFVQKTLKRSILRNVQTPQGFKKDILIKAYKNAKAKELLFTDDASLVESIGQKVKIIDGEITNIKITTLYDLQIAEKLEENLKN